MATQGFSGKANLWYTAPKLMSDSDTMTRFDTTHEAFMAEAIALAERGRFTTDPNPRVGCVIVKDGVIVGRGYHKFAGQPHAEVYALAEAGDQAQGATVYVTLEPCSHFGRTPPCAQALINARVAEVIVAMQDPNPLVAGTGIQALEAAGIKTQVGLLLAQAQTLNLGFITRMTTQKPWVRCKMAMSLDGRTAMASGESQWITGPEARRRVHEMRGESSAIITGVDSICHDNPSLTVRPDEQQRLTLPTLGERQPLRIIVDSQLRTAADAKIFSQVGTTVIVTAVDLNDPAIQPQLTALQSSATIISMPNQQGQVDLTQLIIWLGEKGCNEVMIESGATLSGAFLTLGLIDHIDLFMAPSLLGSQARSLFDLKLTDMAQQVHLDILEIAPIGKDWHLRVRPQRPDSQTVQNG
jgi:diaminohydroxyphosphoribosylaminopyrimidine deaminase/5-amino-6-(5-phosphoribosylamino)uracil reductase